jgi:hypothetical protein
MRLSSDLEVARRHRSNGGDPPASFDSIVDRNELVAALTE